MDYILEKSTVLVVDDTPSNIDVVSGVLSRHYNVKAATNGKKALLVAEAMLPDVILLDIMMPDMDGYEVCSQLKRNPKTKNIPVIFVTAMNDMTDEARGFELGAVDYITKPISPPILLARVKTHLQLHDQNKVLEQKVLQRTKELNESRLEIIRRLGLAAEYRDNETGMHVIRMSYYCSIIARAIGMSEEESALILNAAPMHDVGKIGIPDSILLKPGKLDVNERSIMMRHCEFGAKIIGEHDNPLLQMAHAVALSHHEKWDGSGYPRKLEGKSIPLVGRIAAVADVFDALISARPYKAAWPTDKAVDLIRRESGKHFDPELVAVFLERFDAIQEVMKKHADPENAMHES
ncbi:response regulator [Desulfovibrio inopinatus]|uniref:response regulator n=1 Tax=Desulfovibrio inopinatus TaxID=102109 RepID=UPI00042108CE|nr:two-component system response regulator [Desulfovibrio inopinatus]